MLSLRLPLLGGRSPRATDGLSWDQRGGVRHNTPDSYEYKLSVITCSRWRNHVSLADYSHDKSPKVIVRRGDRTALTLIGSNTVHRSCYTTFIAILDLTAK